MGLTTVNYDQSLTFESLFAHLNRVLVGTRDNLNGVQALERPQLREDVPHRDRLREVQHNVPFS